MNTGVAFMMTIEADTNQVHQDFASADLEETEIMERLSDILKPLNGIDWSRNGALWDGNIVTGGKIRTQAPAVRAASSRMLELLNLHHE